MNQLVSFVLPASGASSIIDFNWRTVRKDAVLMVQSASNVNIEISDGPAGTDPNHIRGMGIAVPYSSGGNPYAAVSASAILYQVTGGQNTKIPVTKSQTSDCLRFKATNTSNGTTTITLLGSVS